MKKVVVLISLLSILLFSLFIRTNAFSFGGCEKNCQKCHSLNSNEVQQILQKMKAPEATKIMDIKMSPVKGLWEVTLADQARKGIMYVDFSKKHILGGVIIDVDAGANKTQETLGITAQPPDRYVDNAKIPVENALLMGEKDAKYKVLVFTDPDCPFCGKLHGEMKKVIAERKDIAFYLKLMPLNFHPDAYWKSQSIICNKSLQMLEDNFEHKPLQKTTCDSKEVDENIKLGEQLEITGTPTLILPNGLVVIGARDAKVIIELVQNPPKKGN